MTGIFQLKINERSQKYTVQAVRKTETKASFLKELKSLGSRLSPALLQRDSQYLRLNNICLNPPPPPPPSYNPMLYLYIEVLKCSRVSSQQVCRVLWEEADAEKTLHPLEVCSVHHLWKYDPVSLVTTRCSITECIRGSSDNSKNRRLTSECSVFLFVCFVVLRWVIYVQKIN